MSSPPTLRLPWLGRRAPERARVGVRVPELGRTFAADVETQAHGARTLLVAGPLPLPATFLHGRAVVIEGPAAGEETPGTLLAVPGKRGKVREDVLQFIDDDPGEPGEPVHERAWVRARVELPVAIAVDSRTGAWIPGRTRDVSAGGALVAGAAGIAPGEQLRLALELPAGGRVIKARARVVRAEPDGLRALSIHDISSVDRDRLLQYVWQRKRESRAAEQRRQRT